MYASIQLTKTMDGAVASEAQIDTMILPWAHFVLHSKHRAHLPTTAGRGSTWKSTLILGYYLDMYILRHISAYPPPNGLQPPAKCQEDTVSVRTVWVEVLLVTRTILSHVMFQL